MRNNFTFFILIFFAFILECRSQNIDSLEFQPGFPEHSPTALQQLQSFPLPRYKPDNGLMRLFNWMNPNYMGGGGQPGISKKQSIETAVQLQEELISHWNYFLFIPNSTFAIDLKTLKDPSTPIGSYVQLANKHPEVPLGTTIFWMQLQPLKLGYAQKRPNILRDDLPEKFYIKDASGAVIRRRLNFAAPDSLFVQDGQMQKKCLQNLLACLTRPINLINENGEEPPGITSESISLSDADMIEEKERMKIDKWHIYVSVKKQHFRELYSSQFMSLPGLKNTLFTVYNVEGGPIDRFDWNATKKTCSAIDGNYYSTPDFYPRHPDNWKKWKGAWHGWKWINDGRKVEIKNGDHFFSPFVAAGWANDPKLDIRPAQWLGLLKCLSVVGAEFYYVAYFNLKAPFTKPEDYVWQAAMPAYAQAITSRFINIFRNGNVIMDTKGNPIVTYPNSEDDVLVTVRKHNNKEQYIIAATVQPESNTGSFPLKKNTEITINTERFNIEARRQGSVYFLDKSVSPYIFYQLDKWHQYEHPMRWRKEQLFEAEMYDSSSGEIKLVSAFTKSENVTDLTKAETIVLLNKSQWIGFYPESRNSKDGNNHIQIFFRSDATVNGTVMIGEWKKSFKNSKQNNWISIKIPDNVPLETSTLLKIISESNGMAVDKICIGKNETDPDLSEY